VSDQPSPLRIERVCTSGVFSLDGQDYDVDNNVWLIGTDSEVIVVDAAHEAGPIAAAVGDRHVAVIIATHGHNDHINAAAELADVVDAPIALHPDDRMLWDVVYPDRAPDLEVADGEVIGLAGATIRVIHTPGHSPGGVSLHVERNGVVFTGDTLFHGGPGATGRSYSDYPTILNSIRTKLFTLPAATVVHTGHGDDTSIGDESPHFDEWVAKAG
jgi:glyoxylase-like metal-dependent hydrolase (beta-lactamase superfamily II)